LKPSPIAPKWIEDFKVLLSDARVKTLLQKKAVVLELVGTHHYWFTVVNIFYQRYSVKISRFGSKTVCDSRCEAWSKYASDCYHVRACQAFILAHKLRSSGVDVDTLIYPRKEEGGA